MPVRRRSWRRSGPAGAAVVDIRFSEHKYGRELLVDAAAVHRLHGFITDTQPHRLHFFDVTFITAGRGELRIDGESIVISPHQVIFTAPGQVRAWSLRTPLRGFAVFFKPEFFLEFLSAPGFLWTIPGFDSSSPRAFVLSRKVFGELLVQVRTAIREIAIGEPVTDALVHGTVYRLLLDMRRHLPEFAERPARARRSHPVVEKYLALLDRESNADRGVRDHARQLAVSPGYLNLLTRRQLGRTAQQVAHDRLLLEARRLLRFTDLTVRQIAHRLGFADPAYFARFFRTRCDESPRDFRARRQPR
jgi:AraC-like DNA-binding protein